MTGYRPPRLALPESTEELVGVLAGAGQPTIIAGGTMLMPRLADRSRRADTLVALDRLPGAADVVVRADGSTTLGPLATYTSLLGHPAAPPLLAHICRGITGGPQIRNQGTVAGAACFANPASDMPTGLVAAGAAMHIDGPGGRRTVPAEEFFVGPFTTRISPAEALVAITLPVDAGADRFGYCKIKRSESSWPLATAAALRRPDGTLRIAVGSALDRPVLLELDDGERLDPSQAADLIARTCAEFGVRWWEDELADLAYRRRIAPVAVARCVEAAYRTEKETS